MEKMSCPSPTNRGQLSWPVLVAMTVGVVLGASGYAFFRTILSPGEECRNCKEPGSPVTVKEQPSVASSATKTIAATELVATTPVPSAKPGSSPKSPQTTLSGIIDLVGPLQNNSSILLLQRKTGQTEWQTVKRLPASDGYVWSFPAITGQSYQISAALQVNDQNTTTSNVLTMNAPAANQVLQLQTDVTFSQSAKTPRLQSCGTRLPNGNWKAEIMVDQVEGANSYWLQVGTEAGKSNTYSFKRNRSSADAELFYVELENEKNFYAHSAYALCKDCAPNQNFSQPSENLEVRCFP